MVEATQPALRENATGGEPDLRGLLPAFQRLDGLLERAVIAAESANGPMAAADRFRGLYISRSEVERLFGREPGTSPANSSTGEYDRALLYSADDAPRLAWIQRAFDLTSFDLDVILIALAPEVDLRYERIYAYLQDDVSRRRPSVDLALGLLCPDSTSRLDRMAIFGGDAPLIRRGLIRLIADPSQVEPPLLAHYLKLDDQVVSVLLSHTNLDRRLTPFCKLVEPVATLDDLPLRPAVRVGLQGLALEARVKHQRVRLYFQGSPGSGIRQAAEGMATEANARLLVVDLARATGADLEERLRLVVREAWFQDAVLYVEGLDGLRHDPRGLEYAALLDALSDDAWITILAGALPWVAPPDRRFDVIVVPFPILGFAERRSHWQASLAEVGIAVGESDLNALADRFRLTPGQIEGAVDAARGTVRWNACGRGSDDLPSFLSPRPNASDLFAAARAQCGHDLAALARQIEPTHNWDDLVLPDDAVAQLHEIRGRVVHRHRVLGEWGFDRKLSLGKGVNALFAGPSGTGKTMATEIIAHDLELDLYKIDLSSVVSKYIGETEKNLDRIFRAAESANAILFFDEADALFGKRSEVRDSHDRYANVEISYLLQKMEEYEGLAILATNLRQNLDDAFVRRLAFTVHFPYPDECHRQRIWTGIWPSQTPLADDVDLGFLARQFKLSGGNIKNVALGAAFLAAREGGPVSMVHVLQAARREYQKLGKVLSEAELGLPVCELRS
jgi:hypothetical protein